MSKITYRQALHDALKEEMRRDESVYIIGEDVGEHGGIYGVELGLMDEFGKERVRTTPISETAIIGGALGSAITGMRPVTDIPYIDFFTAAMDQIVNQTAKIRYMFGGKAKVPMVMRTAIGSGCGSAAQHSQSLEAWFCNVPGLKVVMPSTPYDAKGLLKSSIREDNPIIFIENKLLYNTKGEVPEDEYLTKIGEADVKREGKDITIVATSRMVLEALKAAEELAKDGIECEIIDPRTLVPLDINKIIKSVIKTKHLVVIYEAPERCGYGAEVVSQVVSSEAFSHLKGPVKRVAGINVPMPYNGRFEKAVIPDKERIIKEVKGVLNRESIV